MVVDQDQIQDQDQDEEEAAAARVVEVGVAVDVKLVLGGIQRRVAPHRVRLHDVFADKTERAHKEFR